MRFDGSSGRKPSAEARRYVYAVLATVIDSDIAEHDGSAQGWLFGGLDDEADRRRVKKAARAVVAEMIRKGKS